MQQFAVEPKGTNTENAHTSRIIHGKFSEKGNLSLLRFGYHIFHDSLGLEIFCF